jgi:hypothetical protein
MTRQRRILEQLIKSWAQDHDPGHVIADYDVSEEAMKKTQGYFTWVITERIANIDLLTLVDRIEIFLENRRNRKHPDGMFCKNCQNFYQFAEANQPDGTLICYSCNNSPYV